MNGPIFYSAGHTDALKYATAALKQKGCTFSPEPNLSVTHLLLDVPSFDADGHLKNGGNLQELLSKLPQNVVVFGGSLQHSALKGYQTADLLQDNLYLAENAAITAHCAVGFATQRLPITLLGCPVLVVGWGRIGKCLAALLKSIGATVTVSVRKAADRAMLLALGYDTIDAASLGYGLARYRVIFNTVPEMVLPENAVQHCTADCLKIDLASVPGIAGSDVLWARGLPSKEAPETSGQLICRTVLRHKEGVIL